MSMFMISFCGYHIDVYSNDANERDFGNEFLYNEACNECEYLMDRNTRLK